MGLPRSVSLSTLHLKRYSRSRLVLQQQPLPLTLTMPNEASQSLAMIPEPMRIARDGRRKEMEQSCWAGCRGKEEEEGHPKLRISLNRTASSRECTIATAIDCMSPKLGLCHFPFLILKNLDSDFYPNSFRLQLSTFVSLVTFSSPDPPPSKQIDETRDRLSNKKPQGIFQLCPSLSPTTTQAFEGQGRLSTPLEAAGIADITPVPKHTSKTVEKTAQRSISVIPRNLPLEQQQSGRDVGRRLRLHISHIASKPSSPPKNPSGSLVKKLLTESQTKEILGAMVKLFSRFYISHGDRITRILGLWGAAELGPFQRRHHLTIDHGFDLLMYATQHRISLPNFPGRNEHSHPASNTLDEDDGASIMSSPQHRISIPLRQRKMHVHSSQCSTVHVPPHPSSTCWFIALTGFAAILEYDKGTEGGAEKETTLPLLSLGESGGGGGTETQKPIHEWDGMKKDDTRPLYLLLSISLLLMPFRIWIPPSSTTKQRDVRPGSILPLMPHVSPSPSPPPLFSFTPSLPSNLSLPLIPPTLKQHPNQDKRLLRRLYFFAIVFIPIISVSTSLFAIWSPYSSTSFVSHPAIPQSASKPEHRLRLSISAVLSPPSAQVAVLASIVIVGVSGIVDVIHYPHLLCLSRIKVDTRGGTDVEDSDVETSLSPSPHIAAIPESGSDSAAVLSSVSITDYHYHHRSPTFQPPPHAHPKSTI
ncbi:hypothetical protein D9757_011198 [Collybiopsis confluens]|uniref:Uncharacterized protein n=1 Tax=Collybiopsis confluens TaxID=2823264 RepID=A0A8H5M062_9AGAR|nr:hypothetical protein D9757_011198 [Collybiopsis confluens]